MKWKSIPCYRIEYKRSIPARITNHLQFQFYDKFYIATKIKSKQNPSELHSLRGSLFL